MAYCVEPGKVLQDGDGLVKDENFWENLEDNKTINASTIQMYISRIMYYGYSGKLDVLWSSQNSADANEMGNMIATQILIWETLVGERDSKFNKVDASKYGCNNILDTIAANHPLRSQIMSNYNRIVSSVQSHSALPSFMSSSSSTAESVELTYDSSSGKYKAVLTDSNNVLSKFSFSSSDPGISFSASGNKLTMLDKTVYTVDGSSSGTTNVELNNAPSISVKEQIIKGNLSIIKHTDDGSTQIETPEVGATFEVFLSSAGSFNLAKESERDLLVCDENGFALSKKLPYGTYTVKQTKGWDGRELMKPFEATISANGETVRYIINNAQFEAYLKVVKVDAESGKAIPYAGAGFQILDSGGNPVTMSYTYPTVTTADTFYTNSDGSLVTPDKLPQGKYSLAQLFLFV